MGFWLYGAKVLCDDLVCGGRLAAFFMLLHGAHWCYGLDAWLVLTGAMGWALS